MKQLTAVILAGGSGTRFWPLTQNKVLFPFLGKPLYEYTVHQMLPAGVTDIVIVAHPDNREVFESTSFPVPHRVIEQKESKGMADAMRTVSEHISGPIIILIADDCFDPNVLAEVVQTAQSSDAFGVIVGWKSKRYFPGGYLLMDGENAVGVEEKPGEGNEPSPYVIISGMYIRDSKKFLETLQDTPDTDQDDAYERALSQLMKKEPFRVVRYDGPFVSLKYPWHVMDMTDYLLHHRMKPYKGQNVMIAPNVHIDGPVVLEDNVRIFENTKITGPCYIGEGTIIGNNNIIRHSAIGASCVTGFNSDITRSYIGDECWFHTNYVGDSVLERNISMGSGAVTANLRLDEQDIYTHIKGVATHTQRNKFGTIIGQNVRIGVHASIMPGKKIGQGSLIGSQVMLDRDLPDNTFCIVKQEVLITTHEKKTADPKSRDSFRKKL